MDPRQPSSRGTAAQRSYSPLPQRTGSLRGDREAIRRGQASPAPPQAPEPQYVVYLRLPFNRNGFVDPPQVEWDVAKERYLWKVLSRGNRNTDTDWDELASQLQVSRAFLLQQAAWLYKRELNQIQAQMRRVGGLSPGTLGTSSSPVTQSPSSFPPRPGTSSAEARPLSSFATTSTSARPISGIVDTHPPSAAATPRPYPILPSSPARATSQPMSRGASAQSHATVVRPLSHRFSTPTHELPIRASPSSPAMRPPSPLDTSEPSDSTLSSSSDDDNDDEQTISTHGGVRKLPTFLKRPGMSGGNSSSDDDGEDGIPVFLPFSAAADAGSDMAGTITLPRRGGDRERAPMSAITSATASVSAGSVSGSASGSGAEEQQQRRFSYPRRDNAGGGGGGGGVGGDRSGLRSSASHHHHSRRPSRRSVMAGVDSPNRGSAGPSSPSMGSSFSDLSDASVTQSAMEEAYLSTLQAGGMASRMSSLSQAVRSRYFPPQGGSPQQSPQQ